MILIVEEYDMELLEFGIGILIGIYCWGMIKGGG